jgi:CHASE2 domain-containing sensor protein
VQEQEPEHRKHPEKPISYSFQNGTGYLTGKIVLIGGEFEDARDTYPSPVRHEPISGVELNAQAIESDLNPSMKPIKELHCLLPLFADIVMGILFVWIFWFILDYLPTRGGPRVVLFICATVLTVVFAIFSSWVLFKFSVWMSFIPILIGANIHQYIKHAEDIARENGREESPKEPTG